jgi:hypothetical protein
MEQHGCGADDDENEDDGEHLSSQPTSGHRTGAIRHGFTWRG